MTTETVVSDINKSIEGAQTPAPKSPKAPKKAKSKSKKAKKVAKKESVKTKPKKAARKAKKGPNKALVKAASKAEKSDKPKVRWGSLMSISNDELMKAIKGEKNALSAQGIANKFKCTIWTAKRSVLRLNELSGIIVQTISRQEGKAGVPSACYFIK